MNGKRIERLRRSNEATRQRLSTGIQLARIIRGIPQVIGVDLAGSVARGRAERGCDLDLLVTVETNEDIYPVLDAVNRCAGKPNYPKFRFLFDLFVASKAGLEKARQNPTTQHEEYLASLQKDRVPLFKK